MTIEYVPPERKIRLQNALDLAIRTRSELLSRRGGSGIPWGYTRDASGLALQQTIRDPCN